ncbi:hypothetical protein NEUTE2DRAFT_142546 [Neurospora tetrasperma FGSC 2509]|nr:hypothetical protein NEUTE2DRAFT_142546 [Neurospora tetrasperma FGSC 2509]
MPHHTMYDVYGLPFPPIPVWVFPSSRFPFPDLPFRELDQRTGENSADGERRDICHFQLEKMSG